MHFCQKIFKLGTLLYLVRGGGQPGSKAIFGHGQEIYGHGQKRPYIFLLSFTYRN